MGSNNELKETYIKRHHMKIIQNWLQLVQQLCIMPLIKKMDSLGNMAELNILNYLNLRRNMR